MPNWIQNLTPDQRRIIRKILKDRGYREKGIGGWSVFYFPTTIGPWYLELRKRIPGSERIVERYVVTRDGVNHWNPPNTP